VAVYAFRGQAKHIAGAGMAGLVGIAILATATGAIETIGRRFSADALAQDNRNVIYREAVRIASENPAIGVGPANFRDVLSRSAFFDAATVKGSHNVILFLGTQYGLMATALYLGVLCAFGAFFLGNALYGSGEKRVYAAYGLLALATLFLFGMTAAVI